MKDWVLVLVVALSVILTFMWRYEPVKTDGVMAGKVFLWDRWRHQLCVADQQSREIDCESLNKQKIEDVVREMEGNTPNPSLKVEGPGSPRPEPRR